MRAAALRPVAVTVLALLLAACSATTGSGHVTSESRQVSGFTAVELSGSGEVTVEQTGTESLTITADDNILPRLTSRVSGGTLELGQQGIGFLNPSTPIRYQLTVQDLTAISVSGSGSVSALRLTADRLQIAISGSGRISAGGTANAQQISVSGSGSYRAADLASRSVDAEISGSGSVLVRVSDTLKVSISGSGGLTYIGDPRVEQDISGSGKVIKQ